MDMVADINMDIDKDMDINMEIQFGERVGQGGWFKLFATRLRIF